LYISSENWNTSDPHIYRLAQDLYMAGIHVCTLAIVEINVSVSVVCPQ